VAARALAQYFIDRKKPFTGFDTDRSHTSFARFLFRLRCSGGGGHLRRFGPDFQCT
jgi:hypothetical protein